MRNTLDNGPIVIAQNWKTYGLQRYQNDIECKHYPGEVITYSVGEAKALAEGGRLPLHAELSGYILYVIPAGRTLHEILGKPTSSSQLWLPIINQGSDLGPREWMNMGSTITNTDGSYIEISWNY